MVLIRRLIGWLGRFARWLAEPIRFWVFVLCTAVVATIAWVLADSWEQGFRYAGLLYQWLGIGTVAYGLRETRMLFEHPTIRSLACDWWSRFPRWRAHVNLAVGTAHIHAQGNRARILVKATPACGTPLEERVRLLEQGVDRINDQLWQLDERTESDSQRLTSEITSERSRREAEDVQIRRLLEEALAGGLRIEWMGVFWLFLGVMLGTVPTDIASLFGLQ